MVSVPYIESKFSDPVSLQKLWPMEFNALREVTSARVDASDQSKLNHAKSCVTKSVVEVQPRVNVVNRKQAQTFSTIPKTSNDVSRIKSKSTSKVSSKNVVKPKGQNVGKNVQKSKTVRSSQQLTLHTASVVQHSPPPLISPPSLEVDTSSSVMQ